jgi:rhodanese-related sulfurtransferase
MQDISVRELQERIKKGEAPVMIDVREEFEWNMQHLSGVKKISLGNLPEKLDEIGELKGEEVVLICRSGGRSGRATDYLRQQGFSQARNLTGGMLAWKAQVDSAFNVE